MAERKVQVEVELKEIAVVDGELEIATMVRMKAPMAEQNERLPQEMELNAWQAGQHFSREIFRFSIERADLELVLSKRKGKDGAGIQRIGKRRYTFKTRFGTVKVKRIKIRHKADNSMQIPSSKAWKTQRQAMITAGLREMVGNFVVKESFSATIRQIEAATGEKKLLSRSSVKNILHSTGKQIREAQQKRAEEIFVESDRVKRLLGLAEAHIAEDYFEATWLNGQDLSELNEEEIEELLDEISSYEKIIWYFEPTLPKTSITACINE